MRKWCMVGRSNFRPLSRVSAFSWTLGMIYSPISFLPPSPSGHRPAHSFTLRRTDEKTAQKAAATEVFFFGKSQNKKYSFLME